MSRLIMSKIPSSFRVAYFVGNCRSQFVWRNKFQQPELSRKSSSLAGNGQLDIFLSEKPDPKFMINTSGQRIPPNSILTMQYRLSSGLIMNKTTEAEGNRLYFQINNTINKDIVFDSKTALPLTLTESHTILSDESIISDAFTLKTGSQHGIFECSIVDKGLQTDGIPKVVAKSKKFFISGNNSSKIDVVGNEWMIQPLTATTTPTATTTKEEVSQPTPAHTPRIDAHGGDDTKQVDNPIKANSTKTKEIKNTTASDHYAKIDLFASKTTNLKYLVKEGKSIVPAATHLTVRCRLPSEFVLPLIEDPTKNQLYFIVKNVEQDILVRHHKEPIRLPKLAAIRPRLASQHSVGDVENNTDDGSRPTSSAVAAETETANNTQELNGPPKSLTCSFSFLSNRYNGKFECAIIDKSRRDSKNKPFVVVTSQIFEIENGMDYFDIKSVDAVNSPAANAVTAGSAVKKTDRTEEAVVSEVEKGEQQQQQQRKLRAERAVDGISHVSQNAAETVAETVTPADAATAAAASSKHSTVKQRSLPQKISSTHNVMTSQFASRDSGHSTGGDSGHSHPAAAATATTMLNLFRSDVQKGMARVVSAPGFPIDTVFVDEKVIIHHAFPPPTSDAVSCANDGETGGGESDDSRELLVQLCEATTGTVLASQRTQPHKGIIDTRLAVNHVGRFYVRLIDIANLLVDGDVQVIATSSVFPAMKQVEEIVRKEKKKKGGKLI